MILRPEGDLTIARQFTAGLAFAVAPVPKGRLNPPMSYVCSYSHCVFSTKDRPFDIVGMTQPSLRDVCVSCSNPAVNCRAILTSPSGRDLEPNVQTPVAGRRPAHIWTDNIGMHWSGGARSGGFLAVSSEGTE